MKALSLKKSSRYLLIIGVLLALAGLVIATVNQSDFGKVQIKQLSIVSDEGSVIKAVMYLPKGASKEAPVPGVLAVHGGNSSRYAMANYAQEFARRGYAVISIDQSFNGQSDRAQNDFLGSECVMEYMTTLEFIDQDKLCTIGHSAGGDVTNMVAANPQFQVNACVNLGVGPTVAADTKINLAVIIGNADENTGPRGNDTAVKGPAYYAYSAALANAFGVEPGTPVATGTPYGSLENHDLRVFHQPKCGHLGILFSSEAIALALDFAGDTLGVPYHIPVASQTWPIREFATAAIYAGLFLLVFGAMGLMLLGRKELLLETPAQGHAKPDLSYWAGLGIMCLAPALGIQSLYMKGKAIFTGISKSLFAMEHINGVIFWMLCTAFIILAANLVIKKLDKNYDWSFDRGIITSDRRSALGYLWIAVCVSLAAYLVVYLTGFFGDVCVRLYNTEIHLFTPFRFQTFWVYLPLYLLYYAIIGYVQTSGLLCEGQSPLSQYLRTTLVSVIAPAVMLAIWYGTCGTSGINYLFQWRFVLGVLMNFLPGMAIGSVIQVYAYRRTGKIWLGAFINSILFSWMATSIGVMVPVA